MKKNIIISSLIVVLRIIRWVGWLIGIASLVIMVLSLMDHYGRFSADSMFFGADLVSPLWIFLLLISSSVLILITQPERFWIPLVVGAVYFIIFGDISLISIVNRFPRKEFASENTVRVVTLNVEYYSEGVNKVMDAIDQINADVILLGEHLLSPKQKEQMCSRLDGRVLISGHPNSTAIISRYPIVWWKEVELPSHEASLSGGNDPDEIIKNRHRSFIHAVVKIDSQFVNVISIRFIAGRPKNHFLTEQLRWGRFMFGEQLSEAQFFKKYLSGLHGPVIFGGDLNASASSKTVSMISQVAEDAYMKNNIFGDLTFRTEFPTLRLDYLFSMNGVQSVSAHRPLIAVSDHFPVVATFVLPDRISGKEQIGMMK